MKGKLTGLLAFLIGANINGAGSEAAMPKTQHKNEIIAIKEDSLEKRISEKNYTIKALPYKAGKTTSILVYEDMLGKDRKEDPVEKIILYEDGKQIAEAKGLLSLDVKKEEAGKHAYDAELVFKSGDKLKTKQIEVSFEGKTVNHTPLEKWYYVNENAGKATKIFVEGQGIGDNKGIEKILLYEDGKQIAEAKNDYLSQVIERDAGKHKYFAEIFDKGGNVKRTGEKEVNYSGKAFAPDIRWFSISSEKAGRSINILVSADDEKNVDSNAGIERIAIYENGQKIIESSKRNIIGRNEILETVMKEKPGKFKYYAEAINKNGVVARSKETEVEFTGADMPPSIGWFIGNVKENGYKAGLVVDANDKGNVHNEAGIKEILLYENGNLIHKEKGNSLYKEIVHHDSKEYKYRAEVFNKAGVMSSKEIELKFF